MQRRQLLHTGAQALAATALLPWAPRLRAQSQSAPAPWATPAPLTPVWARPDRIIAVACCTRPFRAQGPRIEAQRLGRQTVVHNYGHGGAGWSLSWGSAQQALRLVQATGATRLGVIGCGAIGLTTARLAQMAGLKVRIYCAERPPEVRSSAATGVWSPESRICTEAQATPAFQSQWEAMARFSFQRFQSLLGLAGEPVMWQDGYFLSDVPFDAELASVPPHDEEPDYPDLEDLIGDIRPRSVLLQPGQHPFAVPHVRRYTQMVFNLPAYTEWLMNGFMRDGGEIITRHFEHPRQLSSLPETTLVNATGWGARALWGDDSLVPVRGQTARLVPQAGVNYGLQWRGHNLFMVSRKDGILVQAQSVGDWGNADATPDRAASVAAVERLAGLFRPG